MVSFNRLVGFALDDIRYALPLAGVERAVRAVEITPLPDAPDVILGVINVQGRVVPVADIRRRFRRPTRDIALSDQIVIAHTTNRPLALVADAVFGIVEYSEREVVASERILPDLEYVEGIAKIEGGLILIHNLDKFLALDEENSLERAMKNA
ncbi:MAG: chemotaxis protein CheW [Burkholderiales bacterium]|nr:chemotaxis protein CheW [Burkholderiales bacterium]